MLGLHFTPVCVLLLACSLHFTLSLHFTPGPQSAVRSPAVCVLHWPDFKSNESFKDSPAQKSGFGFAERNTKSVLRSKISPKGTHPKYKVQMHFFKWKFAFFLRLIDSSSFKWTDMIYLITQLSIVTTVVIVAFKALKLFYFQLSILSYIPSLFVRSTKVYFDQGWSEMKEKPPSW